jgi:hypothetical protein
MTAMMLIRFPIQLSKYNPTLIVTDISCLRLSVSRLLLSSAYLPSTFHSNLDWSEIWKQKSALSGGLASTYKDIHVPKRLS